MTRCLVITGAVRVPITYICKLIDWLLLHYYWSFISFTSKILVEQADEGKTLVVVIEVNFCYCDEIANFWLFNR